MTKKFDVAVVGATGVVGEMMVELLQERNFPVGNLYPLASERSIGKTVLFNNRQHPVADLSEFDFGKVQIALFSAGSEVSQQYAPMAAASGCIVIDNTSAFRQDNNVPLLIPEVNLQQLSQVKQTNIIANPNCSTMQMLVAIKPIYDAVGIKKINVATYQSVSGSGKAAISELALQTSQLLSGKSVTSTVYPQQIAFNLIPHIDKFLDNGFSREEMKLVNETKKILNDQSIEINPTAVRVPVFCGHAEAIHLELSNQLSSQDAMQILRDAPGVELVDDLAEDLYPTNISHAADSDPVFVGRVRNALSGNKGLNLWVVADNIRKGAALNTVQIAEKLLTECIIL